VKAETLIPASWFYVDEIGKTKLNWLIYEYALILFDHVKGSRKKALAKWKPHQSEERIAEFCAHYAKRMKLSIRARQDGSEAGVIMPEYFVSDYWHTNTRLENRAIMEIAHAAWSEKLQICTVCNGGCISEGDMWCEFFDRMERGGYLS
jgi:hypothetical protein